MSRRWMLLILVLLQLSADTVLISQFPAAGRDFIIQLTAGRIYVLDGGRQVYDRETQEIRQAEILDIDAEDVSLLPFNHPPLLLPALGPLSRIPARTAYLLWTVVGLALFFAGVILVTFNLSEIVPSAVDSVAVRSGILVFFPIAVAVAQGQDTALLFFGTSAFVLLLRGNRDLAAGTALALTAIRPQIAVAIALPFLLARRRVFVGFSAGVFILVAYSLLLVGLSGAAQLLELIRLMSLDGELPSGVARMPNLSGLLHRTLDPDSPALTAVVAWTLWILCIAIFCTAWKALGNRVSILHVGLLIAVAVIFSPHIHLHDASLLAITAAISTVWRCGGGRSDWAVPSIALAASSLLLAAASVSPESRYDLLLLAALLLVILPLVVDMRRESRNLAASEYS